MNTTPNTSTTQQLLSSPPPRLNVKQFMAVALAGLFLPLSMAAGANINWATASDGNWTNGAKWTGGNPPANDSSVSGDTAQFDDNGTYTVTLNGDRSVRSLYILANANPVFDFTGYTLTVGNIVRTYDNSQFTLVGGTISGPWYQGYNGGHNSLVTITGANAHVVTPSGANIGYIDGNASNSTNTLVIKDGASFTSGGANPFSIGQLGANSGTNATANSNKVEVKGVGSTLNVNAGIRIGNTGNSGTNTGRQANNNALVIDDGAVVTATQVLLGYIGSTNVTGVSLTGNTLTVGGTGATATLNLSAANALVIGNSDGGNAAIINTGGVINVTNGTTTVGAFAGNTLRVVGGTLNATGRSVSVGNGATMFLGNNGTINAEIVNIAANARFGDKSDAANAGFTSGTLNVANLTNQAAVVFSVGDNSGTAPAILNLVGASTNIHEFKADLAIEQSDGWLTGNGTIRGLGNTDTTLTVNGVVSPGNSVGKISVKGDLVSGADAVFNFELGSLLSLDQLHVSANAGFDGTLNLTLLGGYMPGVGNSFKLFDFATSSGSFDALNLATLDGGKTWDTSALYTSGTISVVPEPATVSMLLLAAGMALIGWRHRRK